MSVLVLHLVLHCLSVVCDLKMGITAEICMFCPNKLQSFEPFMCLGLVLEL